MNMEKMKTIFSDEAFVKSLVEMETVAQVQAALKEKGVEMTEEDILAIRELVTKVESGEISIEQLALWQKQAEDGELSDEVLEQVAGGSAIAALAAVGAVAVLASLGALTDAIVLRCTRRHW